MTRRIAIYTRISDDKEGRALGVARQEADCRELAEREQWQVVATYSDNDISATERSRKRRPGWERMLDDAEAGRFDTILAYTTSRLTRRPREREDLIELHDACGIELRFVASPNPDLSTADGQYIFRTLGGNDTAEAARTAERARRKQAELAESGRHNGPRPYGWDIEGRGPDQRLTINPTEAAVLRECVQRVLDGEGLWRITCDLNDRNIPTSTGGRWVTQVLRRTLLRDRNYGYRKHQPRGKDGRPKGPASFYPGQWEPIVDRDTHDRVVAILTDPARITNNRGTEPKYLLTSLALCGECGRYLIGVAVHQARLKNGRTRVYPPAYKCPHAGCMKVYRRMADVDALVNGVVVGVLERDGVKLLGGDPKAATEARERIKALEAKLAVAADQFAEDIITADQMRRITERLRPQVATERSRLIHAQPEPSVSDFAGPGVAQAWAEAEVETRKRIMRLLGMEVTIGRIGPGNGAIFDASAVSIRWPDPDSRPV